MKNTTKMELCNKIAGRMENSVPILTVKNIFDLLLDEVLNTMANGNKIELRGFGVFRAKIRKAIKARNPRTGQAVDVLEGQKAHFKFSKDAQKIFESKIKKPVNP
jgi:nucleoid DNA-binding protein